MVESISSVTEQNAYVDRLRPLEPPEPRQQPRATAVGDGDPTPPNSISLLANQAGAELLRVQEALAEYTSAEEFAAAADSNEDGGVSRDEVQALLKEKLGEEEAAKLSRAADRVYDRQDADGNESVTVQELQSARAETRQQEAAAAERKQLERALSGYGSAEALVADADTSGDKALDRSELEKRLTAKLGEEQASRLSDNLDRLYERADTDRNNQLTADELRQDRQQARAINIGA